jgi:hypothetical protein
LEMILSKSENVAEIPDIGVSGNMDRNGNDKNADNHVDNLGTAVKVEFVPSQIRCEVRGPSPAEIRIQSLHLQKLIKFVDVEFFAQKQKFEDLVVDNDIRFDLLWLLFPPERHVVFQDRMTGLSMAGEVRVS